MSILFVMFCTCTLDHQYFCNLVLPIFPLHCVKTRVERGRGIELKDVSALGDYET